MNVGDGAADKYGAQHPNCHDMCPIGNVKVGPNAIRAPPPLALKAIERIFDERFVIDGFANAAVAAAVVASYDYRSAAAVVIQRRMEVVGKGSVK